MWDMAHLFRRGASLALGGLLAAGCGDGDDLEPTPVMPGAPVQIRPAEPSVELPREPDEVVPPVGVGGSGPDLDDEALGDPDACRTPNGVSGSPRTLEQAIILMNSLPRPTTLACFLQALERPLSVYMTSSSASLQPAPGARSPRAFVINEPLVMSIVFDGPAAAALELGLRTTSTRSIKTEIIFPLTTDVNYDNFFSAVSEGPSTKCAACHMAETITLTPALPIDVFESDIIRPFEGSEVDVPAMQAENAGCDADAEPERCLLLSAFFDYGDVRLAPNGIMF